jgi:hypothetical protein
MIFNRLVHRQHDSGKQISLDKEDRARGGGDWKQQWMSNGEKINGELESGTRPGPAKDSSKRFRQFNWERTLATSRYRNCFRTGEN